MFILPSVSLVGVKRDGPHQFMLRCFYTFPIDVYFPLTSFFQRFVFFSTARIYRYMPFPYDETTTTTSLHISEVSIRALFGLENSGCAHFLTARQNQPFVFHYPIQGKRKKGSFSSLSRSICFLNLPTSQNSCI